MLPPATLGRIAPNLNTPPSHCPPTHGHRGDPPVCHGDALEHPREGVPGCPRCLAPQLWAVQGSAPISILFKEARPKLAPGACGGGGAGPGLGAGGALSTAGPSPPLPRPPPPPWAPRGRSAPSSCCWPPAPAPGPAPGQPHRAWCSPSWPGTRSTRCRTAWEPWSAWTIPRAASPCGEAAGPRGERAESGTDPGGGEGCGGMGISGGAGMRQSQGPRG